MTGKNPSSLQLIFWLLSHLKPYRRQAAASILCGFAAAASGLGLLASAAWLISAASLQPSIAELQVAIVAVRFFGLSKGVFRYLERLATHSVNFRLLTGLRSWLYERLEPLAPARLIDQQSGEIFTRGISSLETLENFYVRAASPPLVALLMTVLGGLWLGSYHPTLGLIWVFAALLLGLLFPWVMRILSKQPGQFIAETRSRLAAWLVEHLQGLQDLLAFNRFETSLASAATLQSAYDRAQKSFAWLQGMESAISTLIVNLAGLALLAAAIPLVNAGRLDRLLLAVVVIGGTAAFESLLAMPAAGRNLSASLAEAARLHELAAQSPAVIEPASPASPPSSIQASLELEIRNLSFSYGADSPPVLDQLSLHLPPGRHAALLGASSAGKTSLINLLLRFWDYQQGSIILSGCDLRSLSGEQARRLVNCLPAHPHLFNTTLRQNLLLARPAASEEDLWQALQIACLADFASSLPAGLDTPLGQGGARLSAGEAQRLSLARFLLHDGSLWLLDEPTAHLDALTASQVRRQVLSAAGSRSLLCITHNLSGLDAFDWVYILHAGRLVEEGEPSQLLSSGGILSRLSALQADLTIE